MFELFLNTLKMVSPWFGVLCAGKRQRAVGRTHCLLLVLNSFSKTAPFRVKVFHQCFVLLTVSTGDPKPGALPGKEEECVHKSSYAAGGFFFSCR